MKFGIRWDDATGVVLIGQTGANNPTVNEDDGCYSLLTILAAKQSFISTAYSRTKQEAT